MQTLKVAKAAVHFSSVTLWCIVRSAVKSLDSHSVPREIVWYFRSSFHNMEKGYFSASFTHGASAACAGSAPHRDQHLHSLMSTVNKNPVIVIQELKYCLEWELCSEVLYEYYKLLLPQVGLPSGLSWRSDLSMSAHALWSSSFSLHGKVKRGI